MIKLRYLLTLILFAICIFGLFQVKFKVQQLHREVAELQKQLDHEKNSIYVLKAEWAYLNKPERLQKLATKFLNLAEMKSAQIMIAKPDSIIIAQTNTVNDTNLAVDNQNNFIKASMNSVAPKKVSAVKWRYKDRPDLSTRRQK